MIFRNLTNDEQIIIQNKKFKCYKLKFWILDFSIRVKILRIMSTELRLMRSDILSAIHNPKDAPGESDLLY